MTMFDWHADREGAERGAGAPGVFDREPAPGEIDDKAVWTYRQARLRAQMAERGIAACILSDPVSIRYATGTRNMQIFSSRNQPARYLILTADHSILYEFTGCEHLAEGFETVSEVRPAMTASFVAAGEEIAEREQRWAAKTASELRALIGQESVIGVERLNAGATAALAAEGFTLVDAQAPLERARAIKSPEEVKCVVASLRATERGVGRLREAIRPGITENELWSHLWAQVIAEGADYCETRLLNSGPRTNPWFQETGPRVIGAGELICLDTDVVGCHGYYSDFSRTFHSGPDRPTDKQRELYRSAYEQVHHNMALLQPGVTFKEYSEKAWDLPEKYLAHRYYLSAHGCGMTGEYPYLYHHADYAAAGYDGVIEPGMTLCVEAFIGEEGGPSGPGEGVKLEQQVLITGSGQELLSLFPFEETLL